MRHTLLALVRGLCESARSDPGRGPHLLTVWSLRRARSLRRIEVVRRADCWATPQVRTPHCEKRGSSGQECRKGLPPRQCCAASLNADCSCRRASSWRLMCSIGPEQRAAAAAGGQCVNIACNSSCVDYRHCRHRVLEHSCGVGKVANEAASPVLRCLITRVGRWRELVTERAAALECSQAPLAIPSRKWPRCLIGVTHASWPRHAALEFVWAWFSHRRLLCLAARAACWIGLGLKTTPVAECRHVSPRALVDLLSGTGEGRGGSLDTHSTIV